MSVAVYVRVSTVSQNEAGQRREILKWLSGNQIDPGNVAWYVDKESGDTLKRDGFEQLQQIDFSGTVGQMIASVLFAVAQMEQETRRERQAAGIAVAKEKGLYKGRKPGALKAGVDPKRAKQLREKGLTQKEIASSMGISVSSVRRYLSM